jgi:prepilin-type processing-associated H-X9-DG protein
VELLTVMGIIALLLAMLMPAVGSIRGRANQAKCLAVLRQLGAAAVMHLNDHRGYLPAAGWHWAPTGGVCDPAGLDDPDEVHYTYYVDDSIKRPAPLTLVLGKYLGLDVHLGTRPDVEADLRREDLIRHFRCPSQQVALSGLTQREDGPGWTGPAEVSSYVFNEAVLGRRNVRPGRAKSIVGNLVKVKDPSRVLFAMDGRPRNLTNDNWLMVFDDHEADTVYDFQQLTLGDNAFGKDTFDYPRHRGTANVLFLDWHAEVVPMTPGGLKTVGVSKGVYE